MVSSAKNNLSSESTSSISEVAWTALKSPTEYFARIVFGASVSAFSYKSEYENDVCKGNTNLRIGVVRLPLQILILHFTNKHDESLDYSLKQSGSKPVVRSFLVHH